MEADLVAQRYALFCLSRRHPEWTYGELAATIGHSESWGNKWLVRFKRATSTYLSLFQSPPTPVTPHPRPRHSRW